MADIKNPSPRPGVPAGLPGQPDLSMPNATDQAQRAMDQRDRQARETAAHNRGDERLVERDASYEEAHGGQTRVYGNEDWSRAMQPTDPERRRRIREMFSEAHLPNLPRVPGWHRCWVSTTHPSDTPQRRMRLGYRFLKYEDMRQEGWASDQMAVKDADSLYLGNVMWREMIAMECPADLHHDVMREFHHDQPMEQARGIYESVESLGETVAGSRGTGKVTMEQGMETLRQFSRPPSQFET